MRELTATELVHVYGAGNKCYEPPKCEKKKEWCDEHDKCHPKNHKKDHCKPEPPKCPPAPCHT